MNQYSATYKNRKTKASLIHKLKSLGACWSYNMDDPQAIPDDVIIEECLRWGDVPEIIELFSLYPLVILKRVWKERIVPDERLFAHNYYLARIFFNIKNPQRYLKPIQRKYSRYEQIKKLTSRNTKRITKTICP